MHYFTIEILCGGDNSTSCNVTGESCIGGVCKCGQANSCESRISGSYCDPIRGECRCSEKTESCSDPSRGTICDTINNSCNCSSTALACSGNEYCSLGSCIERITISGTGSCNVSVENRTKFELTSPGYPNGYPTNKDCHQRITLEENVAVKLTFLEFFLESDDNCHYDWMKIYDGGSSDSQVIGGKLCGTNVPEEIVSSTNELIVAFHSDDNDANGGYRIKVETAAERCYCEFENGGPENNGIMCGFDGIFERTTECGVNQWCTGPANMSSAVLGSSQLCKKATFNCGGNQMVPECRFCPVTNEKLFTSWCDGNCEFNEIEGTCAEITDEYVKVYHGNCFSGQGFGTLEEAKYTCSNMKNCVGILDEGCKDDFEYYLCLDFYLEDTDHSSCIYKKKESKILHSDFVRRSNAEACSIFGNTTMKNFVFQSAYGTDEASALQLCEKYCSIEDRCWGCSKSCNANCQWIAISSCPETEEAEFVSEAYITQKPVCHDTRLKTKYDGHLIRWELGPCSSTHMFESYKNYMQRCCALPGTHILTCFNTEKDEGWSSGSLEYQDRIYCDDFMSYKTMHRIEIKGNEPSTNSETGDTFINGIRVDADACCSTMKVIGAGEVMQHHSDKLGKYELSSKISNERKTYKLTGKEYFMHWSPDNSWMVSRTRRVGSVSGFLKVRGCAAACPNQCSSNRWEVFRDREKRWETNQLVHIECEHNDILAPMSDGCPENTRGCDEFSCPNTCYCADHCSWKKCTLSEPPEDCLHGTNATWQWNHRWWSAKYIQNENEIEATNASSNLTSKENEPQITIEIKKPERVASQKIKQIQEGGRNTLFTCYSTFGLILIFWLLQSPKKLLNDPTLLTGRIRGIFITTCLFLLAYLLITQTMDYLQNKDSSVISYKRFNQDPLDEYPTFSICLRGSELYWNHEHLLYANLGATSSQYIQMLRGSGIRQEYNETSELYEDVPLSVNGTSKTDFHDVALSILNVIDGVDFVAQQDDDTVHYGSGSLGKKLLQAPFYVGYQSPNEVCFTRNSSFELELIRVKDMISLKRSLLNPGNHLHLDFRIIIHHPGQLLRSFKNPTFRSTLSTYTKSKLLELKVSHVTTLRKRKDSNVPCNAQLKNDDLQILKEIIGRIGCIPVYWEHLIPQNKDLDRCNTPLQLKIANKYIQNFEKVMYTYDPPCIEMTAVVKITRDLEQRDEHFWISIQYVQSFYQEIQSKVLYTFEIYFSSLGGFVGICVGTSMMEIPNILEHLTSRARQTKLTAIFGKCSYFEVRCPVVIFI